MMEDDRLESLSEKFSIYYVTKVRRFFLVVEYRKKISKTLIFVFEKYSKGNEDDDDD